MALKVTSSLLAVLSIFWLSADSFAHERYKNGEYLFSVPLSRGEIVCSTDSHGVTIAFEPGECGKQDVGIYGLFNGPLDTEFPTAAQREVCGAAPIARTGMFLDAREWRVCALPTDSHHIHLYYFNKVARPGDEPVDWIFISVDARLYVPVSREAKSELKSLIGRIHALRHDQ